MSKSSEQPQQAGDSRDLWSRIERQAESALAAGALHRIDTTATIIEEAGVAFVVRRATNLERKLAAAKKDEGDPFMAPEPELFVTDLSPTHYALLNKYNVLDRHLLVVTRGYVDQDALLDEPDFEALAMCMEGESVLGFYNGGRDAGASQPHKHLQVVRLPLSPREPIPIEALIARSALSRWPFRHAFARIEGATDSRARATILHARYRELLEACRCDGPYNLLVAHNWMLLVPRTREDFEGIAVNSLAFAGALFVRTVEQMRTLERLGPMALLRGVARATL